MLSLLELSLPLLSLLSLPPLPESSEPDEPDEPEEPDESEFDSELDSLLLPLSMDEFYAINDNTRRISGLYFTTLTRDRAYVHDLLTGPYRNWFPINEGRVPPDFPLNQYLPLNNMDQLFLTDRTRWGE